MGCTVTAELSATSLQPNLSDHRPEEQFRSPRPRLSFATSPTATSATPGETAVPTQHTVPYPAQCDEEATRFSRFASQGWFLGFQPLLTAAHALELAEAELCYSCFATRGGSLGVQLSTAAA